MAKIYQFPSGGGSAFQWKGNWLADYFYTRDSLVGNHGDQFVCLKPHLSSETNEPGIEPDSAWNEYWSRTVDMVTADQKAGLDANPSINSMNPVACKTDLRFPTIASTSALNANADLSINNPVASMADLIPMNTYMSPKVVVDFDYATPSPLRLCSVKEDQVITHSEIQIITPFNMSGVEISIGHTGDPQGVMASSEIIPTIAAIYSNYPNLEYGGADTISLSIIPNGATAGSGRAIIITALKT